MDALPVEEMEAAPTEAESNWEFAHCRCLRERFNRSAKECLGEVRFVVVAMASLSNLTHKIDQRNGDKILK